MNPAGCAHRWKRDGIELTPTATVRLFTCHLCGDTKETTRPYLDATARRQAAELANTYRPDITPTHQEDEPEWLP